MSIREEFKAWLVNTKTEALFQKCGERLERESCSAIVKATWLPKEGLSPKAAELFDAWHASRDSLVIQRPEKCEFAEPDGPYHKGYRQGIRNMIDAIEAAGLKVTP